MATLKAPEGSIPPKCSCGCSQDVNWRPGKGWALWRVGHSMIGKPGTRLGAVFSEETKRKMSESMIVHYAGIRRRDLEPAGRGVYNTVEYKQARSNLVEGKPCGKCGSLENVHAHHEIPGNDSTLVPLCRSCHVIEHRTHGNPYNGRTPIAGSAAPLCACGCGRPVKWKRVRGWATYCKGHSNAKVPGGTKDQAPPLCQCGCGEPVKFRHGLGWNPYKTGHRQRVTGGYRTKPKTPAP